MVTLCCIIASTQQQFNMLCTHHKSLWAKRTTTSGLQMDEAEPREQIRLG